MDLLFLPQPVQKDKRITPRLAFRSYHLPQAGTFQHSGFCYVGKNTSHIARLTHVYNKAYATEKLENVKLELLRCLENEKNDIPEVIFCEARYDFDAIKAFTHFLRQHPILSAVPFILEGSSLSDTELDAYKKNTRPDEILFLQSCEDRELKQKIQFLRKIKVKGEDAPVPRIEENVQQHRIVGHPLKRAFDILVASIALLLLSPLFLLIAIAIKLESRGPVFYIAKRAGKGYKIFNFYKFRTMYKGADAKVAALKHLNQYGAVKGPVFFKVNNDPRITRIGKLLRNTSLDELPQLLNVFLGDMSLVGNRPLPLYEAETLTTDDYAARFLAPAGITGLWQVKKRGNKEMSVEERINIDIAYAANCSFTTDLWIIANTPSALLQKENV